MATLKEYVDEKGRSPFAGWFETLEPRAASKVATALLRMEHDNFSIVKGVGFGVFEYRIDYVPGYRIYLGKDGTKLVILLGGGIKKRQQKDINDAQRHWKDYKERKKKEL